MTHIRRHPVLICPLLVLFWLALRALVWLFGPWSRAR